MGANEDAGLRGRPSPFRERFFFAPLRGELFSPLLAFFFFLGALFSPAGVEFAEVGAISTLLAGYFPDHTLASALAWRRHGRRAPRAASLLSGVEPATLAIAAAVIWRRYGCRARWAVLAPQKGGASC